MGDGEIKIDLNSRVFVANLPSDQISKDELRDRFSKYGFVKGKLNYFSGRWKV